MGLFSKVRRNAAVGRLTDEVIYAEVLKEFQSGVVRDGLWAKALAESDFDEGRTKAAYLRLRVQSFRDEMAIALSDDPPTRAPIVHDDSPKPTSSSGGVAAAAIFATVVIAGIGLLAFNGVRGSRDQTQSYAATFPKAPKPLPDAPLPVAQQLPPAPVRMPQISIQEAFPSDLEGEVWRRKVPGAPGTLVLSRLSGFELEFQLNVLVQTASGSAHTGELRGTANSVDGIRYVFVSDPEDGTPCELVFDRSDSARISLTASDGCRMHGGMGVFFDGDYTPE